MKPFFYFESFLYFAAYHTIDDEPFFDLAGSFQTVPQEILTLYNNLQVDYKKELKKNKECGDAISLKYALALQKLNYEIMADWYAEDINELYKKIGVYEDDKKAVDILIKSIASINAQFAECSDIAYKDGDISVMANAGFYYYNQLLKGFLAQTLKILEAKYDVKKYYEYLEDRNGTIAFGDEVKDWYSSLDFAREGRHRLDWTHVFVFYFMTHYLLIAYEESSIFNKVKKEFVENIITSFLNFNAGINSLLVKVIFSVDLKYPH
ncbi:MAG: hypothetical protein K6A23_13135 [Butyrivibrio sp.]|nr:hypothetical protein [Butyrivibrio sp.]